MITLRKIFFLLLTVISFNGYCLTNEVISQEKAKLIKFIINKTSWPSGSIPKDRFTICLLGEPENAKILQQAFSKTQIKNRSLLVKALNKNEKAFPSCQILYITEAEMEPNEQKQLIDQYAKYPLLLLSDMEHFAHNGGSMNFVILQKAVALTVNMESLNKAKLSFDLKELDQVIVVPDNDDLK
ncbi:YfiR/HmsC family protein [Candidatus Berkiella aquae]|nr:YfiR family protein [Candidatus Berkiella aquae]